MTQQSGQVDINATIEGWAEVVIKIWREKIMAFSPPIWETGELFRSLKHEFERQAGNDIDKIEFAFKLYGQFVDMGVGREYSKANSGDVKSERQPRPWFSSRFYREIMKLREMLVEEYGKSFAYNVANQLSASFDQRYGSPLLAKSVDSLRSVKYREVQSERNARNYERRRNRQGSWRNEYKTWKPG